MSLAAVLCLVVAISDGDTLKARCGDLGAFQQVKIRLAEIDAPEKGQAFGQRSKAALSDLCYMTQATIRPQTLDRYGRTVAKVECRGLDAGSEMVRLGMAWRFIRYSRDPNMQRLEDDARSSRRGLWSEGDPITPWEWRKNKTRR